MAPLLASAALVLSILSICVNGNDQGNYTDSAVAPTPSDQYVRYLTLFGTGSRTYTCDPSSGSDNYTLSEVNYELYPAEPVVDTSVLIGRRVYMPTPDYAGGNYAMFTKVGAFTYWIGRVVKTCDSPTAKSPLDLPDDLELVTERSEPKPYQTDLDLGIAAYVTRFGAVGGALPPGQKCTPATQTVVANGTNLFSFWKKIA